MREDGLKKGDTVPGSQEVVHENPYYKIQKENFVLPNGKDGTYYLMKSESSVMMIPILPDGRVRFVKQWRYTNKKNSIELPCGNTKHGNTINKPEEAARLELAEEACLKGDLEEIGILYPCNGFMTEKQHVFVARNCEPDNLQEDESEEFELVDLTEGEINKKISNSEIDDSMTIAAWALYRAKSKIW